MDIDLEKYMTPENIHEFLRQLHERKDKDSNVHLVLPDGNVVTLKLISRPLYNSIDTPPWKEEE
jgi:hypothetical protein